MFGRLTPATRRTLRARRIATLLLAAVALAAAAPWAMSGPDEEPQSSRPRLVLLIVVDQLRYDLLARYRRHFVRDGFQRFIADGVTYTRARYLHAATDTCPGHAVIATGSWGTRMASSRTAGTIAAGGRTSSARAAAGPRFRSFCCAPQ